MEFTTLQIDPIPGVYRYSGKVREVFIVNGKFISVATDRISAFDHILPRTIPYKGQVLNEIAAYFLNAVKDIVPVWLESVPDPNVSVGIECKPIKLEMVIRGYLTGHAWREYKSGKRSLCGVPLPENMSENDPFPEPIITPATKADAGHDVDISKDEILRQQIVSADLYEQMEHYTRQLFARGLAMALNRGLLLVDTKYEFGLHNNSLVLMDEIHTPDSSRYFYRESYFENQLRGMPQQQLSKEFVREWLISQGFQGRPGDVMPTLDDELRQRISKRYIQLYEIITGLSLQKMSYEGLQDRIAGIVKEVCLSQLPDSNG